MVWVMFLVMSGLGRLLGGLLTVGGVDALSEINKGAPRALESFATFFI
jgi:hypothetical protein